MKTQTTVQTATTEKYTKKSKQKVVTQKIVTTVKTTTTVAASQQNAQTQEVSFQSSGTQNSGSAKTSSQKASKHTISNVASIAPKMDSRVLNAYARMGFTERLIRMPLMQDILMQDHEASRSRKQMRQFIMSLDISLHLLLGNVDQSSAFASVYNSEKAKFTGYNKAYATQNAAEYFAESSEGLYAEWSCTEQPAPEYI